MKRIYGETKKEQKMTYIYFSYKIIRWYTKLFKKITILNIFSIKFSLITLSSSIYNKNLTF